LSCGRELRSLAPGYSAVAELEMGWGDPFSQVRLWEGGAGRARSEGRGTERAKGGEKTRTAGKKVTRRMAGRGREAVGGNAGKPDMERGKKRHLCFVWSTEGGQMRIRRAEKGDGRRALSLPPPPLFSLAIPCAPLPPPSISFPIPAPLRSPPLLFLVSLFAHLLPAHSFFLP